MSLLSKNQHEIRSRKMDNQASQSSQETVLSQGSISESSQRKKRYATLNKLYSFKVSSDKHNEDAKCRGCGKELLKIKNERLVEHSRRCTKSDASLIEDLLNEFDIHMGIKLQNMKKVDPRSREEREELQSYREKCLVELIATDSLPLTLVDSVEFRKFAASLNEEFKIPSRRKLTRDLLPARAKFVWSTAMGRLKASPEFSLTLELDGWSSSSGQSIVAIVVTTRKGGSMLIDLVDASAESHTSQYLSEIVASSVQRSGIPTKMFNCIVTDEASNFKLARQKIKERLESDHLIEYRCLAHVLNLIGAHMSEALIIKRHLKLLVEFINTVSRNQKLTSKLCELGANRLKHPVPTRWFSTCAAINSVLALKPILELVPKNEAFAYHKWSHILDDEWFWEVLSDLKVYYDHLSSLIGRAEACNSTLGETFHDMLKYGKFLFKTLAHDFKFRDCAIIAFVTHFSRLNLDLMLAAYVLNPNSRLEFVTDRSLKKAKLFMLKILFDMGYDTDSGRVLHTEFERYIQVIKNSTGEIEDVYEWWQSSRTVVLKVVGARLAACHSSSANTERVFSGLGRILTPSRNRLHLRTVFELMSIKIFRLSRNSVKATRTKSQKDGESEVADLETNLNQLDLGDHESEASLFDPDLSEFDQRDDNQTPHLDEFIQSTEYFEFRSFIDFDRSIIEEVIPVVNTAKRSSDQRARELLEALENERRDV